MPGSAFLGLAEVSAANAMVGLPASRNRDTKLMVVMPFLPTRTDSFRNEYH